jgi:SAM-dependent methyltransferase
MKPKSTGSTRDPYDELPYCAFPVEWTAPERLALASLLHGGPRLPLERYRVLELGCANGANLLPMSWYRQHAEFTGLDSSARQIALANDSRDKLGLKNLHFVHGDFRSAVDQLEGPYDIIMAHGVFSWVADDARDAMLEMCTSLLTPDGLLYLNYNAHPGWTVRGMVRDFLLQQTVSASSLKERAELCREISARVISPLKEHEHAFTKLMANEFTLVINQSPEYIAHEYLSPANRAYWRKEFFDVLQRFGFSFIADADFNSMSNRITESYADLMKQSDLDDSAAGDSADLMCYRQMQSPVLTHSPLTSSPCTLEEFSNLFIASKLVSVDDKGEHPTFRGPSGEDIEITHHRFSEILKDLQPIWPRGRRIASLFTDVAEVRESLEYMLSQHLIELRCIEPGDFNVSPEPLNELERSLRNISTSPWHRMDAPETAKGAD